MTTKDNRAIVISQSLAESLGRGRTGYPTRFAEKIIEDLEANGYRIVRGRPMEDDPLIGIVLRMPNGEQAKVLSIENEGRHGTQIIYLTGPKANTWDAVDTGRMRRAVAWGKWEDE